MNLRGLGENATLTLLNGHRMAPSAFGNVVDISIIPLIAIDHIDVLTDGASAVYGADAVAGVVNIVLKKDYDGADTQASFGRVTRGSLQEQVFGQTFGRTWSTGSLTGSFDYSHVGTLPARDRAFTVEAPEPTNIINPSTEKSVVLGGNQHLGDQFDLHGDALASWKSTSNVVTRSATDSVSAFSNPHALNLHMGLSYALTDRWLVDLGGTYGRQETDTGFDIYPGTVTLGRYSDFYVAAIRSAELSVNGTLMALPGGDLKLALGATRRTEDARNNQADFDMISRIHRNITAEFAEFYVPLVGERNGVPLVDRLVLSAAVRRDQYSGFGATSNPKIGILWAPTPSLDFKANWSTAFRAPSEGELLFGATTGSSLFTYPVANPSGAGTIPIFFEQGQNPNLGPESARNLNFSVDYKPTALPGLALTLSYYQVHFHNRIVEAPFDTGVLLHPQIYGSLVSPVASDAAASALITHFLAQGGQFYDFTGTGATGIRYVYDAQLTNAAVVDQNGVDFTGEYSFSLGSNGFHTSANVAFINKIETQFSPTAVATNLVNTYSSPLRWRLRYDLTWMRGPLELTTAVNESNAYTDTTVVPYAAIGSWTTVDLSAAFRPDTVSTSALWHGVTIRLNAINLLDRAPPYAAAAGAGLSGVHYDVGNASPMGRFVSAELRKSW